MMWEVSRNDSRFDLLLAILVFFVWVRSIMYLRGFAMFGPMFKLIQAMVVDLMQFLVIWGMVLLMFSSVSVLVFGALPTYSTLFNALMYWCKAGLGGFDFSTMVGNDARGVRMEWLYDIGVIYTFVFLLVNLVLLFNLVIAILSDTFAVLSEFKTGLFNNNLNQLFSEMDWDE